MKKKFKQITEKYEALTQRERYIVFFAGLLLVYSLLNSLLLGAVVSKRSTLQSEITLSQTRMQEVSSQMKEITQAPLMDVDSQNKAKIEQLKKNIETQTQAMSALQNSLITPQDIPKMLNGLLQSHADVRLLSMKNLAPVSILQAEKSGDASQEDGHSISLTGVSNAGSDVYKHGLEITVAGQYLDLMRYAAAIENLPMHVLWSKAALRVKDYPTSELTLTLYTLSLDKTWLSI